MFYLYYNEEGVVTGVSNTNTEPGEHIEISEDMFMDFNEGQLDMLNFIVVENNLVADGIKKEELFLFVVDMKAGNTVILLNFIGNFSNSSLAWILTAIHFGDLFDNKYKKNLNILGCL